MMGRFETGVPVVEDPSWSSKRVGCGCSWRWNVSVHGRGVRTWSGHHADMRGGPCSLVGGRLGFLVLGRACSMLVGVGQAGTVRWWRGAEGSRMEEKM